VLFAPNELWAITPIIRRDERGVELIHHRPHC